MFIKKLIKVFFTAMIIAPAFIMNINAQVNSNEFSLTGSKPLFEKMFAHTDKDFYLAGEILWFKLYNVSADSLKLLDLSKVAYVEILNAQQKPVLQATIVLNNGTGSGSFYLTSSLASGNYIFRAYTNWMKNFGVDVFFQKQITVVNTLTPVTKNAAKDSADYDIGFYPEGGNLMAGTSNKIGFKILDHYGYGVDGNGYIIDENNQKIVSFSTLKFGMGSFYFMPQQNHTYSAVVNVNNKSIKKDLPAINNDGYVMHISGDEQSFNVAVHSNNNVQKKIYAVAFNNNQIRTTNTATLNADGDAMFTIAKNTLPQGTTHIVLFDENKLPVCERVVFIKPQPVQVSLSADNKSYATRSEVKINIASSANANLSLSVLKTDSLQTLNSENILSCLYLSTALKGNIESAPYYFTNNDANADSALENLLLTQGWSRLKYDESDMQSYKSSSIFSPEIEGHIVEGMVTEKATGLPAKNIRAYASAPGLYYRFASAVSNDSGKVYFDIKDYYGSGELVVQTSTEDSLYQVEITNPFFETAGSVKVSPFFFNEDKLQQLRHYNVAMQVQNAYSLNQLNIFNPPPVDTTAFYGKPDASYLLDNYTRFNTMEEVLREYIANVDVRIRQGNYSLLVADVQHHSFFSHNPLVLVDGVPVFNMNKLMAYNPLKIKKAEVVFNKYLFNSFAADGILSYTTYKGDLDGFKFDANTTELNYDGLQLEREFYSPKYITAEQKQSRLPDYRNVLYWQPQVTATGNTQLSFFTSDVKGKYTAVIQGVGANGKAGYATTEFEVK